MSHHSTVHRAGRLTLDPERRSARLVLTTPAVDLQVIAPLEELLAQAAETRPERIEIDLSAVSFADSSVVGLALKAREHVAPGCGQVVLKAPAQVRRLFEVTRTAGLFVIVPA